MPRELGVVATIDDDQTVINGGGTGSALGPKLKTPDLNHVACWIAFLPKALQYSFPTFVERV